VASGSGVIVSKPQPISLQSQSDQDDPRWLFEKAVDFYYGCKGEINLEESARYVKLSADLKYADAEFNYGYFLQYGIGVQKDLAQAMSYYKRASEHEFSDVRGDAMAYLGLCLEFGEGVTKDYKQIAEYYKSAADMRSSYGKDGLLNFLTSVNENDMDLRSFVHEFKCLADAGDAWAACVYGRCLEKGKGVQRNVTEALRYYGLSAAGGDEFGQENFTRFLNTTHFSDSDLTLLIVQTIMLSGDSGAWGQYFYGHCLEDGTWFGKNLPLAALFYSGAAVKGNVCGLTNLIRLISSNVGTAPDLCNIALLFKRLADKSDEWGQCFYGLCLEHGTGVEKNIEKAFGLFRLSAEQGNPMGRAQLLRCLCEKELGSVDITAFAHAYKLMADKSDAWAACVYGVCLEKGKGVKVDLTEAAKYYKQSAVKGDTHGEYYYGCFLYRDRGEPQNLSNAVKYFGLSADKGNASAQWMYGNCMRSGEWGVQDVHYAARYYKLSAMQGNSGGQYEYARCLYEGTGVARDVNEAAKYFKLSAMQGNSDGQRMYERCIQGGIVGSD
jgi:TPR repeat protein